MPAITVNTFRGERPRVTPRLLAQEQSTKAINCQFENATLKPYNGMKATSDTVPANTKTLFRYLNTHWFTWDKVVDAIYSPVANDDYQRVYYTDGTLPKVTNNEIFNGPVKPALYYTLGIPAGKTEITAKVNPPTPTPPEEDKDPETRFYTYTYVSGSGEEGPPAPVSSQIDITYPASTVSLTLPTVPANQSDITHVRIYRTATASGAADFFYVTELKVAIKTYEDKLSEFELGPALETEDFVMPNSKMEHLTLMGNGIVAGAWGNTVAFCEPYLPYAWPERYQLTTESNVVSMKAVGNNLLVATESEPWIFYGVSSEAMAGRKVESKQACVSRRSMAAIDGLIMYASPDGLVAFNGETVELISGQVLTRKQWQAMEPETIEAYYYEGFYLAFYGQNLDKAFLFSPGGGDIIKFNLSADCAYSNLLNDHLFVSNKGAISIWNEGTAIAYTWRSKEFHTFGDAYTCAYVRGEVANIALKIIIDGKEQFKLNAGQVPSVAFRLPPLRGRVWQFELEGTGEVLSVSIATSMAEIQI